MTPLEFNKTGGQVQLEIFEKYFDDLNQQLRVPQANTDYSDRVVNLDEKLSFFKEFNTATYKTNAFELPMPYSGTSSTTQQFTVPNPASNVFTLTGNALTVSNAGAIYNVFVDNVSLPSTGFSVSGATLTLTNTPATGLLVDINIYPKRFYRLGEPFYTVGALPTHELQRVSRSELFHLNASNLTKPSVHYPVYLYENNLLYVYPTSIQSGISVSYVRKPIPPDWSFSLVNNTYQFNPKASMDFELHPSEQTELILKILLYAGVEVRDPEIIQVAASQVQQEEINQKS